MGPDHPHIEVYLESKHGNIFAAKVSEWDWDYPTAQVVPFDAPTCATCHMSKVAELESTHAATPEFCRAVLSSEGFRC